MVPAKAKRRQPKPLESDEGKEANNVIPSTPPKRPETAAGGTGAAAPASAGPKSAASAITTGTEPINRDEDDGDEEVYPIKRIISPLLTQQQLPHLAARLLQIPINACSWFPLEEESPAACLPS